MDYRGDILEAGIPIQERFDGRVFPPVKAAWSNGRETILVDAVSSEFGYRPDLKFTTHFVL